jgi:hypothetical protein
MPSAVVVSGKLSPRLRKMVRLLGRIKSGYPRRER